MKLKDSWRGGGVIERCAKRYWVNYYVERKRGPTELDVAVIVQIPESLLLREVHLMNNAIWGVLFTLEDPILETRYAA